MKSISVISNPIVRIIYILFACMLFLGHTNKLHAQDLPGPAANLQTLPTGSYLIPMDNTYQFNGGGLFNLKAYGLIVHLLNNGIRVRWVIASGKVRDGIDFSATTELRMPAVSTTPVLRDFRGGPFVIFQPDTTGVIALINSFNTANALIGNARPKLQRTLVPAIVDVRYDLNGFRPKGAILNDGGNQSIHQAFMTAASIPAANYAVSAGRDLITGCYTFASEPHNDNTGAIVDTAIMSIREFVGYGGNFLAECAAVENYENSIYGRFHTTTGITIINAVIGTTLNFANPNLSFSQMHGSFNGTASGSIKNWRVNAATINNNHNHVTGTLANSSSVSASVSKLKSGTGGLVFYLGGHNYTTGTVEETNGIRMYMNAFVTPSLSPCTFVLLNSEIKSFTAAAKYNTAILKWTITQNENAAYFSIEKSLDGMQFITVGRVNKSSLKGTVSYNFVDDARTSGRTYYRIIIHSNTSSVKYSNVVVLGEGVGTENRNLHVIENPVKSTLAFNYASAGAGVNELSIYNSAGAKIFSVKVTAQKGSNVFKLPVEHITSKGLYYIEIMNSRERLVSRFVKN